jgi:hypothetical protein
MLNECSKTALSKETYAPLCYDNHLQLFTDHFLVLLEVGDNLLDGTEKFVNITDRARLKKL